MSTISAGTTSTTTLIASGDTTGSLVFKTNDTGSGGTTAMTIDTSQNVGIGTSSPTVKLYVSSNVSGYTSSLADSVTNAAVLMKTNSSDSTVTSFGGLSGGAATIQRSNGAGTSAYDIVINPYGGNLLVGTTTNYSGIVTAYGNSDGANNPMVVVQAASGSTSRTSIQFYRVSAGASVGSITTTNAATAYNTSSDYRLKENIQPMTGALAKVTALKPVTYTWKIDGASGEGFIAHELAEVVPQCVTGEKDAVDADGNPIYQGIDTSFLVATLTAAIQELKALNDAQASTITQLTERISALENK